ncbi:uncharacterized protein LOC131599818 [Vicia villosa]|uniref:uncharacterized protein LOC131599818 n=1 Tax=Vicia villosa TaxID=3911 RepID=UPI00273BA8AB|nr:uncharacterized protein LOC131599818 [Vicia villosa]
MNKSISNTPFDPGPLSLPPSTTTMSFPLFAHNYFAPRTVIFNIYYQMNYLNSASKVFDQMPNRDFIFLYLPRETIFTLNTSLQHVGKMSLNIFSVMLLENFMFLFDPGGSHCWLTNLLLKFDDDVVMHYFSLRRSCIIFGKWFGSILFGSQKSRVASYKVCWPPINGDECFDVDIHAAFDMAIQSFVYDGESDKNIEIWKIKELIKVLEAARGNETSRISMIMPPHDQISRVTKMLGDEYETASNIKSRVNRQSVLGGITSTQQRLKLYNKVPLNGLVFYTSTSFTDDGREKKVTIDFEPFKPISASLYPCDNMLHTETLNELLSYMQVLSTCFTSFAHGGNDVSHAIGPLAGALSILQGAAKGVELVISIDVIAWGGIGIVAGLMIWGYRVIAKIVKKIMELMPTRGFAAEFAVVS